VRSWEDSSGTGGVVGASLTAHILLATPGDRSPYRASRARGILHCCCACTATGTGSGADVTGHLTGLWGGSSGTREPTTTQGLLSFGEHGMDEAVGPTSGSGELSDAGPLLVLCLEVGAQLGAGLSSDADALLEFRHELPLSANEQSRCREGRRSLILRIRLPRRFARSNSEQPWIHAYAPTAAPSADTLQGRRMLATICLCGAAPCTGTS
jgi:hypothetical protein